MEKADCGFAASSELNGERLYLLGLRVGLKLRRREGGLDNRLAWKPPDLLVG